MKKVFSAFLFLTLFTLVTCRSQTNKANYDESKVPGFVLPELLVSKDGKKIMDSAEWQTIRRPELLEMIGSQEYGLVPDGNIDCSWQVVRTNNKALKGQAVQQDVQLSFSNGTRILKAELLVYLPAHPAGKVSLFLGYNFGGNQTVTDDPSIPLTKSWIMNDDKLGITDHRATNATRGDDSSSWPLEDIIRRGYGVATMYYGDIDPDYDDEFQNGLQPLFYKKDQTKPGPEEWGSIAAWAWGLSRALDYLQTNPAIDGKKVIVFGHSRLGKTALWAGAQDQRFAMVVSNCSGCGGAALSKRAFGETVSFINTTFPHWFCSNFKKYNNKEENLPFDQHELMALIAPRPLYIASATEDQWADPRGEFLSGVYASPVYHLFGVKGLERDVMPFPDSPDQNGEIAYHIHTGKHAITAYDWKCYMDFADKQLK